MRCMLPAQNCPKPSRTDRPPTGPWLTPGFWGGLLCSFSIVPTPAARGGRQAVFYRDTSGWLKNTASGRSVPIDDDFASRTTAVFKPSDDFTASASYQRSDNKRLGTPYQIVDPTLNPVYGEGVLNAREDILTHLTKTGETTHLNDINLYSLKLEWKLGRYSLVSQTARVDYNLNYDDDFD